MPEQFRQMNEPLFIEVHDGCDDPIIDLILVAASDS
jgi:hypothetical protein